MLILMIVWEDEWMWGFVIYGAFDKTEKKNSNVALEEGETLCIKILPPPPTETGVHRSRACLWMPLLLSRLCDFH